MIAMFLLFTSQTVMSKPHPQRPFDSAMESPDEGEDFLGSVSRVARNRVSSNMRSYDNDLEDNLISRRIPDTSISSRRIPQPPSFYRNQFQEQPPLNHRNEHPDSPGHESYRRDSSAQSDPLPELVNNRRLPLAPWQRVRSAPSIGDFFSRWLFRPFSNTFGIRR